MAISFSKSMIPCIGAALLLACGTHAVAQDMESAADEGADRARNAAQITAYAWLAGFAGDIRPGPASPTFRVDKSFGDLLETSDGAFWISGFVRRDRTVFMADFSRTKSSEEGLVPTGLPAPFPPAVPADGGLKLTSLTGAAGYRVAQTDNATLDLLAGARAWWVRPNLQVPALGVDLAPRENFVDPILAARANFALAPRLSALVYGDIGGFGVGSEATAQIAATLNYRVGRSFVMSGGYRYLGVDYERDGVVVDARLAGPVLGATVVF